MVWTETCILNNKQTKDTWFPLVVTMAHILESRIALVHLYSRNKSDKYLFIIL